LSGHRVSSFSPFSRIVFISTVPTRGTGQTEQGPKLPYFSNFPHSQWDPLFLLLVLTEFFLGLLPLVVEFMPPPHPVKTAGSFHFRLQLTVPLLHLKFLYIDGRLVSFEEVWRLVFLFPTDPHLQPSVLCPPGFFSPFPVFVQFLALLILNLSILLSLLLVDPDFLFSIFHCDRRWPSVRKSRSPLFPGRPPYCTVVEYFRKGPPSFQPLIRQSFQNILFVPSFAVFPTGPRTLFKVVLWRSDC